jgi:hypothetical protein
MSALDSIVIPEPIKTSNKQSRFNDKINAMMAKTGEDIWNGNFTALSLFYMYLLKKYKSSCLLFRGQGGNERIGLSLHFKESTHEYSFDNAAEIMEQLFHCIRRGVSTIIIPLFLSFYDETGIRSTIHANVMIYRKRFNTIEHFEPHGKMFLFSPELTEWIHQSINNLIVQLNNNFEEPERVTLVSAEDSCPIYLGPQALEENSTIPKYSHEKGYCGGWSLFMTELALCNPEMSIYEIHTTFFYGNMKLNELADLLRHAIRGYTRMIYEKILQFCKVLFNKELTFEQINSPDILNELGDDIALLAEVEMDLFNNPQISRNDYIRGLHDQLEKDGWIQNHDLTWHNNTKHDSTPKAVRKATMAKNLRNVITPSPSSPSPRMKSASRKSASRKSRSPQNKITIKKGPALKLLTSNVFNNPQTNRRMPPKKKITVA